MQDTTLSLKRTLTRWLVLQRIGKQPSTQHYYRETVKQIRRIWRAILDKSAGSIDDDDVTRFALGAGHFSASRWNGMLTVLHSTVPAARALRRRPQKLTRPPPPTQAEFKRLLFECDQLPRSHAGLVVDFLGHSGLRITAARA